MRKEKQNRKLAAAYLMAEMESRELDAFEERLFADSELSDSVDGVENDLIDEYLRGEFSANERDRFETHFLISERRRGKLTAATVLHEQLFAGGERGAVVIPEPGPSVWDRLISFVTMPRTALTAAAMATLILAAAFFLLRQPSRQPDVAGPSETQGSQAVADSANINAPESPLPETAGVRQVDSNGERPREAAPAGEATPERRGPRSDRHPPEVRPSSNVFAIALFPVTRSGVNPEFVVPPGAESISVKVTHNNEELFVRYRVELRNAEGVTIWNREVASRPAGRSVTVMLPGALLRDGSYEMALLGVDKTGQYTETNFYNFSVERK